MLDDLVTEAEAHQLLTIAKKGLSKGGGADGASILGKPSDQLASMIDILFAMSWIIIYWIFTGKLTLVLFGFL